ncbi:MAG: hypothetical protein RL660_1094 [Bacteroidota bacterium]|jgi:GNAT superfamily N-acetyltransferase
MHLVEVSSPEQLKAFVEMPVQMYKQDANYIRPLDKDVYEVFNPDKNKLYKTGKCKQWLLQSEDGTNIGRIAAFVNKKYKQAQPTGGMGFFECPNNQEAANLLLDTAKRWLQSEGMEAMDGPINFGERDKFWGVLVSGYDEQPLYGMTYNPPYYKDLLEAYGFQVYFHQLCFGMHKDQTMDQKFKNLYDKYDADPDFELRTIDKSQLDKYAEDFCTIYNAAFAGHGEGKALDIRMAKGMFASMKAVMDPKICWYVYYKNQPVAMWINLPDLNDYFKYFNGKLGWWQKLQFVYLQKFRKAKRFVGIVYGVHPDWQGKGCDAYMIWASREYVHKVNAYDKFEMQWIGDFNPKMVNLSKNLGASEVRRLSTYRYLFDRTKEFKRMGAV